MGMTGLPSVERLVALLSRFPGIGRKSALRMVFHLLRTGHGATGELIDGLKSFRERVGCCTECFHLAETAETAGRCFICADEKRDSGLICVVEEAADVMALEAAGLYQGRYHVLGGRLSPLDGIGPQQLHFAALEARLRSRMVREVILATNPTVEGEATAHFAARLCKPHVEKVTRLAFGLPMGGELEYVDESTLYQALSGRRIY